MAKRNRAYKSEKRRKELVRKKKKEQKMSRRLGKTDDQNAMIDSAAPNNKEEAVEVGNSDEGQVDTADE